MKYIVDFYFMDGKIFPLEVSPDDIDKFMADVSLSAVFFKKDNGNGIWIAIDKVRYFKIRREGESGCGIVESDREVPKQVFEVVDRGEAGSYIEPL